MRYVTLAEVVELHRRLPEATGGASGIRDFGALEFAVAQPKVTFDGVDLYPTLVEKAAALGFSLVQGHPFVDSNKRVGHAAIDTFLVLNGTEIDAPIDDQERVILDLATARMGRARRQLHVSSSDNYTCASGSLPLGPQGRGTWTLTPPVRVAPRASGEVVVEPSRPETRAGHASAPCIRFSSRASPRLPLRCFAASLR